MSYYYRATGDEYLAITGPGISDIMVTKKACLLPGQSCTVFSTSTVHHYFDFTASASDEIDFKFTAEFIIGPRTDDQNCLLNYARFVSGNDDIDEHVRSTVYEIVESAVCNASSERTYHDLYMHNKSFEQKVYDEVEDNIDEYGLGIFGNPFIELSLPC